MMPLGMRESTTRVPRAESDWHTGTHYLSGDGASGSYAEAATNAAARVVFGAPGAPVFTVACWVRNATGGDFLGVGASDGTPLLWAAPAGETDYGMADTIGAVGSSYALADPGGASWVHVAITCNGTDALCYGDGTADTAGFAVAGTYAACDVLKLLAGGIASTGTPGDIRDFALWDRALSSAEVAALHTAGVGHDLRDNVGAYTGGGPEHWYPADGDSGTTVTDRGSVGGCDLTLHGGVTIEEA